jgi:hypothetical protein
VNVGPPDVLIYAAGVQRRWQKLAMRSLHSKRVAPLSSVNLSQLLQRGWHPVGDVSAHRHCGGIDLVHALQLSQHGYGIGFGRSAVNHAKINP